jgi:tRNA(Ile)-lysidine synthase
MNLLEGFQYYIKKENLFHPKDKLLLAVSGGVDSVVLCELCKQAGYDFIIAHCNFQLRGKESERDEQFVKQLGQRYGVEVLTKKFDTLEYASESGKGIQEAARDLRYYWLLEVCAEKSKISPGWHTTVYEGMPVWKIVTAHHLNDSVETMLMNFFKGTGIKGLKGIRPKHELLPAIFRPLLFARKTELLTFAKDNQLEFVEDSSNASDKYTRNFFRNKVIPLIKEVFPQVEENLSNNLQRFTEIDELYRQSVELHKKKLLEHKGNEMHIPVLKLQKTSPLNTIVYEIVKDYDFTPRQADEVIGLLKSESGKYVQSPTHRVIRNRNWLIISPNAATEAGNILIEEEGTIAFATGSLTVKKIASTGSRIVNDPAIAQIDADEVSFPLLLRKWKQGDYFYPLGMQKKKKISRFLIDQKLSVLQKEKLWVIETNKKIIWVVGMRIDDRVKITEKTKRILQMAYSPAE